MWAYIKKKISAHGKEGLDVHAICRIAIAMRYGIWSVRKTLSERSSFLSFFLPPKYSYIGPHNIWFRCCEPDRLLAGIGLFFLIIFSFEFWKT